MKVSNLASIGQIKDQPGWQLPPEAWTTLSNIRIDDKQIGTIDGWGSYGTATAAPYYLLTAADDTEFRWIYPSLTAIYMTSDGATHYDVTGTAPTGTASDRWNGCVLNGLPVLNNGVDVPQYMADLDSTTDFATLTGWDSGWRAKIVRSFRNFLFAFYTTESSTSYPQKVRWSTSADAGGIPSEWAASTTNDAGSTTLAETIGAIVDAFSLGDQFIIYKDDSAYICQYIGGTAVFRFARIKTLPGMLAQDCGCEFESGHFVVSDGDAYVTDGQTYQSVIDDRNRDALFQAIDADNWANTFVFHHKAHREIWVCYPSSGQTWANAAYIWNYTDNTWSTRSLPTNTTFIAEGVVDATTLTWNTLPWSTWTNWEGQWGTARFSPVEDYPIGASTDSTLYQFDEGNQAGGTNQLCIAERKALSIGEMDDTYEVSAFYPYAEGGAFDVYIGGQSSPNAMVEYDGPYSFDPATDYKIDVRVMGRFHSVKFQSQSDVAWAISGYEFDAVLAGTR